MKLKVPAVTRVRKESSGLIWSASTEGGLGIFGDHIQDTSDTNQEWKESISESVCPSQLQRLAEKTICASGDVLHQDDAGDACVTSQSQSISSQIFANIDLIRLLSCHMLSVKNSKTKFFKDLPCDDDRLDLLVYNSFSRMWLEKK
jgi:hypothetical protein